MPPRKPTPAEAVMDLIEMPDFNLASQNDRGDWGLRCVTDGSVRPHGGYGKPDCIDHGAMNAVNPARTIWRCLMCGRGCYVWRDVLFEERIEKQPDGCWYWTGPLESNGYGKYGRKWVHRIAYEKAFGEIPVSLKIDHTCHNGTGCDLGDNCPHRRCVNPSHLEAVTHRENTKRGQKGQRRTNCRAGHDLTDNQNLYFRNDGSYRCKECVRLAGRKRTERGLHRHVKASS